MGLEPVQRMTRAGTTAPLPQAGPDAFGAAIGRGMEGLGRAVERYDLIQRDLERTEENADAGKRFAELKGRYDEFAADRRANAAPGAAGHLRDIGDFLDTESEAFLASIKDDRVRRGYQTQLEEFRTSAVHGERLFADASRIGKLASDETDAQRLGFNRIETASDLALGGQAVEQERAAGYARIDDYPNISADQREKMRRGLDQGLAAASADLALRTDPAAARRLADSGAFNDLPPEQIDQYYARIGVEERRAAAAVEHQANLAKAQVREHLATVNARLEAGEDVPDAELQDAQGQAAAIGDDSGAYRLGAMRIKAAVNRETDAWTPQQFSAAINDLRAKGEKRTADEDIRLKQLEARAPALTAEFNTNPGAWAARNGAPPPALDLSDPASITARRRWRASVSRETGRPVPFLQPAELDQLQATYQDGPQGRLQVIDAIAPLGGIEAVKAMRQVAPDDHYEQQLVLLDKGLRGAAMRGVDARKANPALIDEKGDGGSQAVALDSYRRNVAPAMALADQRQAKAVFDVAANLYADWAARTGAHDFNQGQFDTFQQIALGARRDAQGRFHGGVGYIDDHPVLLPPELTQDEFATRLARMSWSDKWAGAPVWSNGEKMTPADVRRFTPVQRGDGRYVFTGPNGTVLRRKDGSEWTARIDAKGVHP